MSQIKCGLTQNVPHKFTYLNAWSLASGSALSDCETLGGRGQDAEGSGSARGCSFSPFCSLDNDTMQQADAMAGAGPVAFAVSMDCIPQTTAK